MSELFRLSAFEAVTRLRERALTPSDLVEAAIARIEAVDGAVNALPIRCFERAREQAAKLSAAPPSSPHARFLHGLPIAVKDYNDVGGVRTTYGSPIDPRTTSQA
jgi:amidase